MDENKNFRAALRDAEGIAQKAALPVPYHQRFEGRRVFDDELALELTGCELVQKDENIEDGCGVIGPELSSLNQQSSHNVALLVRISNKQFLKDYEAVLERDLYRIINYADGIKHKGQSDNVTLRFAKTAVAAGFNLQTLANLIYAGLKSEYGSIIHCLNVQVISDAQQAKDIATQAQKIYETRAERLKDMRDSDVQEFYSCTICQSNSPHHVCIISPERTGACGSCDYLTAKASAALNPYGPHRLVIKGETEGERAGQWSGINDFVFEATHQKLHEMNIYSIVDNPPPFSDCMECISALIPSLNAVVVLDRRYRGQTPLGMTFAETQDCIIKGASVTGLMGHARVNLTQGAYLKNEGGIQRIMWMPTVLKKDIAKGFNELAARLGEPHLLAKIADETIAVGEEETVEYNKKQQHPYLQLPPVI